MVFWREDKTVKKLLSVYAVAGFLPLFGMSTAEAGGEVTCGPGHEWIDQCTQPSTHTIATRAIVGVDLNLDNQVDTTLVLTGNMIIDRTGSMQESIFFPGTPGGPNRCCSGLPANTPCTGGPGQGTCPAGQTCNRNCGPYICDVSVTSVALTDGVNTLRAGGGTIPPGVTLAPSRGVLAESANDDRLGDEFFDMVGQLDRGSGPNQYLYTHGPFRMAGVTDRMPFSRTANKATPGPVSLFSDPVGGVEVARLITLDHGPVGACCLPPNLCPLLTQEECDAQGGVYQGAGTTVCPPGCVPTVSEWGVVTLTVLMLSAATIVIRRRALMSA